jgi:hypothetical protein
MHSDQRTIITRIHRSDARAHAWVMSPRGYRECRWCFARDLEGWPLRHQGCTARVNEANAKAARRARKEREKMQRRSAIAAPIVIAAIRGEITQDEAIERVARL